MIWRYALDDTSWMTLRYSEKITRLNRQLRFETLPIVYEKPYQVSIEGETPADWVKSVEEVIDDFSGKSASGLACCIISADCVWKSWRATHHVAACSKSASS